MRVSLLLMVLLLLCLSPAALADEAALPLPDTQILVNPANPLPSYLEPEALTPIKSFVKANGDVRLREDAAGALKTMLAAMKEAGVSDIYVSSGYRSFMRQSELYKAKVASYRKQGYNEEQAASAAARWVLPPGESEHQTGLTVDFSTATIRYQLNESFAATAAGKWLYEHSVEYGFILRYHGDKEEITGIAPEPWHFRYVGADHAVYMREHDLCLEEYHALINESNPLLFTNSAGESRAVYYQAGADTASLPGELLSISLARKNSGEYIITMAVPVLDAVEPWTERQRRFLPVVNSYADELSGGDALAILSRAPQPVLTTATVLIAAAEQPILIRMLNAAGEEDA